MKRVLVQIYAKNRDEAFAFYENAFNATVSFCDRDSEGKIIHAELDVCGQNIAVGEYYYEPKDTVIGNTMQFCMHFDKGEEGVIQHAYETMREGGTVLFPLGPCFFSPYMTDLIDKYGVHWCLFV